MRLFADARPWRPALRPAWRTASRLAVQVALLCCCLLLTACFEARLPDGVVATVNGEPITLRRLQALLDSRSPSLGTMRSNPSLEKMKHAYGEALGTLIIYALVRQDLHRLHMSVSPAALNEAVDEVKKDYGGEDGLNKYLTDESLDPAEWRALLLDHLSLLSFEKRILAADIHVSLPELRAYYQAHAAEFQMPESLRVCLVSGASRQDVEAFCAAFPAGLAEKRAATPVQCQFLRPADVPQEWRKAVAGLKAGKCAPVRAAEGQWRSVALLERRPAVRMSLVEVYPLVERALREQKMAEVFENWLERTLAGASILVARELAPELLAAPSARATDAKNGADDAQNQQDEDDANAQPPAKGADYEGDAPDSGPDPTVNEDHGKKDANDAAAKAAENPRREREAAPSGGRRSSRRR